MTHFSLRPVFALATAALLSACGGGAPADQHANSAALMVQVNAPVADCEAEGCNRPRIVDGLAEQYRNSAAQPATAEPLQPGEPPAALSADGASVPAPAAAPAAQ